MGEGLFASPFPLLTVYNSQRDIVDLEKEDVAEFGRSRTQKTTSNRITLTLKYNPVNSLLVVSGFNLHQERARGQVKGTY